MGVLLILLNERQRKTRGCSSMVGMSAFKLNTWVRFPSPRSIFFRDGFIQVIAPVAQPDGEQLPSKQIGRGVPNPSWRAISVGLQTL